MLAENNLERYIKVMDEVDIEQLERKLVRSAKVLDEAMAERDAVIRELVRLRASRERIQELAGPD